MKHLLTILFIATALAATSQTVTFDTVYFQTVNGILYQISRVEYDDGSYNENKASTTKEQVLDIYAGQIETDAANIATAGRLYLNTAKFFNNALRTHNTLNTALQVAPLRALQIKYEEPFIDTATTTVWQLQTEQSTTAVTFSKSGTGQLLIKVGSDANRVVVLAGQLLRIQNYPATGQLTYLLQVRPNVWQDIAGEVVLRRVNLARQ